ncbi:MAG: 16S rRNA processing protein RimM [Rickettsiales bacterium]|nr:16S rRNA processing protein RimM [Rickettsiales bacterium]
MKKILIAKVNSVFGIKGEIKLIVFSDNPHKIEKYSLFDAEGNSVKIKITNKNKTVIGTSSGNPILIAKIDGVNDRNAAELLRGQEFFVAREELDELDENEFYYADLIGMDVVDMASKKIGTVLNVLDLGAGGIIEIKFNKTPLEKIDNFPFKNEFFPEVNLKENFVRFDAPEILEDLESKDQN